MKLTPLNKEFFLRSPEIVAKQLLGKLLVRKLGSKLLIGKIVETEAYFGREDPASRASLGWPRYCVELLYGEVGRALVYMVHGNWLLNVVAHETNGAGAVLIRAMEPLVGFSDEVREMKLTSGPGRLSKVLHIDKRFNGMSLINLKNELLLCHEFQRNQRFKIRASHRIGVSKDLKKKLRFFIDGNEFVSNIRRY
ncbi:MAG: DNA-3-methyladenine glycosylase [Candidatus Nanoarchaeia archaeon]|nr:DNA-3-methyladenine glycosylase [Candidatus Haiyanarchaeum thermophilum]